MTCRENRGYTYSLDADDASIRADRRDPRKSSENPAVTADPQAIGPGSVDAAEIARFSALAATWWDPSGPMAPLHQLNPARLGYIRDRIAGHYGRDAFAPGPIKGLTVLDIGCAGGLLCEPLTRLGARVTGIDAAAENVAVAKSHAEAMRLDIDYRHASPEDLTAEGVRFDAVLALEVVEHVADVDTFLQAAADLVKPGGLLITSTLNRTAKSFALAIVGAEYLLRWLPAGTHDWRKFLKPSELARSLRAAGLTVADLSGLTFDPFRKSWRVGRDVGVNYILTALKPDLA
jgi:2-polyprenyl-6-hydroxyphenyl methylase / 3-demethylubiquinone-9 3-methyltransferase